MDRMNEIFIFFCKLKKLTKTNVEQLASFCCVFHDIKLLHRGEKCTKKVSKKKHFHVELCNLTIS